MSDDQSAFERGRAMAHAMTAGQLQSIEAKLDELLTLLRPKPDPFAEYSAGAGSQRNVQWEGSIWPSPAHDSRVYWSVEHGQHVGRDGKPLSPVHDPNGGRR